MLGYISESKPYDMFFSAVFLPQFSMLSLSLPTIALGSKSTSLIPGFCVRRPRPVPYNFLRVESHFLVLCFFVVNCVGEWNQ